MSRLFEKIEIPEIDLSETEKAIKNIWAEIDRIAKDTQEQKDNAMAMEFTKCIGELLKKNGVVLKVTEYTAEFDRGNTFERRYGVSIDELDFSEHDKVFEDKIELLNRNLNLQKDKRCEVEIERNYLAERINQLKSEIASLESHMLRIRERCTDGARRHFENGTYGCLTIVNRNGDLELENKELKQRIAELESKESVKPMRIEFYADNGEMLTPLEVANSLINQNTLEVDELRELAEHLQVYCRHHRDRDAEETISF